MNRKRFILVALVVLLLASAFAGAGWKWEHPPCHGAVAAGHVA